MIKHLVYLAFTLILTACGGGGGSDTANPIDLQQLRGQWVVINYWAQWCKPCIREIPELNDLNRQYRQVTVLGVNYDGVTGPELEQQLEKLGIAFATLPEDPARQLGVPRPVVLPTTFILNPQGQLHATLVGPQTLESLALATGQAHPTPNGREAGTDQ